jgi:hypothetical protein
MTKKNLVAISLMLMCASTFFSNPVSAQECEVWGAVRVDYGTSSADAEIAEQLVVALQNAGVNAGKMKEFYPDPPGTNSLTFDRTMSNFKACSVQLLNQIIVTSQGADFLDEAVGEGIDTRGITMLIRVYGSE